MVPRTVESRPLWHTETKRSIDMGDFEIPIPGEDAPARQLLDFAAVAAFSKDAVPGVTGNPMIVDAAKFVARAYMEEYHRGTSNNQSNG